MRDILNLGKRSREQYENVGSSSNPSDHLQKVRWDNQRPWLSNTNLPSESTKSTSHQATDISIDDLEVWDMELAKPHDQTKDTDPQSLAEIQQPLDKNSMIELLKEFVCRSDRDKKPITAKRILDMLLENKVPLTKENFVILREYAEELNKTWARERAYREKCKTLSRNFSWFYSGCN